MVNQTHLAIEKFMFTKFLRRSEPPLENIQGPTNKNKVENPCGKAGELQILCLCLSP